MRASGAVGRVGGLAVALGIGAAAAVGSIGVASAAPAEDSSSTADSPSSSTSSSPRKPRPEARTRTTRGANQSANQNVNQSPNETPRRTSQVDNPAPAAAARPAKPARAVAEPAPAVIDQIQAPVADPARVVTLAVTPAAAAVNQAPPALRAAAPRVAPAATVGTVQSVPVPFSSSGPFSPAESAMSWTVLAAVRRLGRPDVPPAPAATTTTGQIFQPRASARVSFFSRFRNKTPTAAPTQNPQGATGVITGSLNAKDGDGDRLTYTVVTNPSSGTLQVDANGGFVYTPTKAAAHDGVTDQFSITVSDESAGTHRHGLFSKGGHTVTSTIRVTVTPINAAPVATADSGGPDPSTGIVIGQITATDEDGDPISFSGPASTTKGSVVVGGDGAFTYTPTAAARHAAAKLTATAADRTDTFALTASDDRGGSTAVPVTVLISPTNADPTATTSVGSPNAATGVVSGQVAGADADGDPLSYAGSTTTTKGTVVVGADGAFTYTPTAVARHNAAALTATASDKIDLFAVTVTDEYGGSKVVPVTVTVSPFNTAPTGSSSVGAPDSATGVVVGTITATDADGDALSFSGASTAKGTATVSPSGQITYTPTAAARHAAASLTATAAEKADTFTIGVTDGHGGSIAVPVTVVIGPANAAPTGTVSIASTNSNTGLVTGSVLGADADGDPLTFTGSTTTAKGSAVVAANGGFTYTPTEAAREQAASPTATAADKSDTFTVTVRDGYGGSTAVAVTVPVVPANVAPVITSASVGAPNPSTGIATGSVVATDVDADTLSYTGSVTSKGTATVSSNGTITYTPTAAARHAAAKLTATQADKTDLFTVTVSDGRGGTASRQVSVTIAPANAAPTGTYNAGVPDASTGVVAGAILGADLDGDALSYSGSATTSKGTVTVSPTGSYTYTPTALARHVAGLSGATLADTTDTFTVRITDGYGGTVNVPVTVTVSPANVNFVFVYGSGSQYWTPEAKAALETAATRLESALVTGRPITVTYDVVGENNPSSGWLGTSYANFSSGSPGFYGTVVQTRIITGVDTNGSAADSQIGMNFYYPWALGDTVPNNKYDFQSVATHELVHTLGIMSGLGNPSGSIDRNWTTYDSFLVTADGTDPIGADYVWNATYTPNLTGANGGLYFAGPNAVAVYGGPVPLYTPGTWQSGTSLVHLDPADAPPGVTYLMDPSDGYGLGVRTLSSVEVGILKDLGYTVYQSGGIAFIFVFGLRRRQRSRRRR